jgi:hypothetical protein
METNILGNTIMENLMDLGNIFGKMVIFMRATLLMEQDKDKEFCVSKMVRFMRVNLRMM